MKTRAKSRTRTKTRAPKKLNHWKIYIVLHGESALVKNDIISQDGPLTYTEEGIINIAPNIITIDHLKQYSNIPDSKLRLFRCSQPGAVFMSDPEANKELRDEYVGKSHFPGFGKKIIPGRHMTAVGRDVDGDDEPTVTQDSIRTLLLTLQMFNDDNDEIFNERLLTDVGEGTLDSIADARNDFGVWIQCNNSTWYRLMLNTDEFLCPPTSCSNIHWNYIRTWDVVKEIVKRLQSKRELNKMSYGLNVFKDNDAIDLFIANCSPPTPHNQLQRGSYRNNKFVREKSNSCQSGNEIRWLNNFNLLIKRIQIFENGKQKMHYYLSQDVNYPREDFTNLSRLTIPWSIIDKEERHDLYKNFICLLINYNSWLHLFPHYQNFNDEMKYLIRRITTPLSFGGISQLTDRHGVYDTVPACRDAIGRYLDQDFLNYAWFPTDPTFGQYRTAGVVKPRSVRTMEPSFDAYPTEEKTCREMMVNGINTIFCELPRKYGLTNGGKKTRKKRRRKRKKRCSTKKLKQKMICHKGTKKQLKKLRKRTKKLKLRLTKCSRKRLKKWNIIKKKHKRHKK